MKKYRDIAGDGGSQVADQVGEQLDRVRARLSGVRHVVAVMSGKGGVGKSSVAVHLASALALEGRAVGIVDADINGSSIPAMTGVRGRGLRRGATGMIPAAAELNLRVASIDLLLSDDRAPVVWDAPTQRDAHTWRAMMEVGAVRELLADVEWGALDFLFVDLPPGSDRLSNVAGLLPGMSGTVIVTTPATLSRFVVGKSIRMARSVVNTPVIGLVENMSSYVCPQCGREEPLLRRGNAGPWAAAEGVPYLGSIPFDPRVAACADEGVLFMARHADTPAGAAIRDIAAGVGRFVEQHPDGGSDPRAQSAAGSSPAGRGGR